MIFYLFLTALILGGPFAVVGAVAAVAQAGIGQPIIRARRPRLSYRYRLVMA